VFKLRQKGEKAKIKEAAIDPEELKRRSILGPEIN